jgi:thymidylate synthase (FAD)
VQLRRNLLAALGLTSVQMSVEKAATMKRMKGARTARGEASRSSTSTDLNAESSIPVLDRGYVRIEETMGDDLSAVNDARVSFGRRSATMGDREARLLRYLAMHEHTSPFRGAVVRLEIKAPIMVARHWFKYRVGTHHTGDTAEYLGVEIPECLLWTGQGDDGGHGMSDLLQSRNEVSRRYVTLEPEYYMPTWWRGASVSCKQGSAGPVRSSLQEKWSARWLLRQRQSIEDFREALRDGLAPELARVFLYAYALYTEWRWTASLQSVAWFLHQRDDGRPLSDAGKAPAANPHGDSAQWEIRCYARAVRTLLKPRFPRSLPLLLDFYNGATNDLRLPADMTLGQFLERLRAAGAECSLPLDSSQSGEPLRDFL